MKNAMYYAVYDISNNRTRERVITVLKNTGFSRIQKSVFCGNIEPQQRKDLVEELKQITGENESVYLIQACNSCFGKLKIIGHGFDQDYISGKKVATVL